MKSYQVFAAIILSSTSTQAESIYPGYEWIRVDDDIYVHSRQDPFEGPIDGNSIVIINESDVFIIDTHINPAVTRAVIKKIQSLTNNPVSNIINTHWHDDHVNGNNTYQELYPDVQIISHPYTLEKLNSDWQEFENSRRTAYDAVTVKKLMDTAIQLESINPDQAITYRVYAGYVEAMKPELPNLKLAYPNITVEEKLEFDRGNRKIIVQWVGRGNTDGDLIVWLPKEKLLITGDILVAPIPYAFDSPLIDWIDTLNRLQDLKAKLIIPGHGKPQKDYGYLQSVKALIEATIEGVRLAHSDGATKDELAEVVNLEQKKASFTNGDPVAVNAWNNYYLIPGLKSAWVALGFPVIDEN